MTMEFPPEEMDDEIEETSFEELDDEEVRDTYPRILVLVILVNTVVLFGLITVSLLGPKIIQGGQSGDETTGTDVEAITDFVNPDQGLVTLPREQTVTVSSKSRSTCDESCCCNICLGLCWLPQPGVDLAPIPTYPHHQRRRITKSFTLICVFEFIRKLLDTNLLCTDYVYITAVPLARTTTTGPYIFTREIAEIDSKATPYNIRKKLLEFTKFSMRTMRLEHVNARWYIGMWGDILSELRDESELYALQQGLYHYFNGIMQKQHFRTTDFDGFAVINSRGTNFNKHHRASADFYGFWGILPANWTLLHTVYALPGVDWIFQQNLMYLREANVIGLSFSNDLTIPSVARSGDVQEVISLAPEGDYLEHYRSLWGSRLRYIRDVEQQSGKTVCHSISTAIYRYRTKPEVPISDSFDPINATVYTRIDRVMFDKFMTHYRLVNASDHAGRYLWEDGLHRIFAFSKDTLQPYVDALLETNPASKCIVIEDIGEDSQRIHHGKEKFGEVIDIPANLYLKVILEAMKKKYGYSF